MSRPEPMPPTVVVEVDVSRDSQQALVEAVSEALRRGSFLTLRHTTELGLHAYGNHVLSSAADYARRRGIDHSPIACRVLNRIEPLPSPSTSSALRPHRQGGPAGPEPDGEGTSRPCSSTPNNTGPTGY